MDDQSAWDMFFCTLVGFQFHPANKADWTDIDLEVFADIVERMMVIRREYAERRE